jgi:hypothetical protein
VLITSEEVVATAANTPLHSEQQLQQLEQAQDDASATAGSHASFSNSSSTDNATTGVQFDASSDAVAGNDDAELDETELESVEDEEAEPVYLTVGDYFGEDAIINPTERTATYKVHIMHVCIHSLWYKCTAHCSTYSACMCGA